MKETGPPTETPPPVSQRGRKHKWVSIESPYMSWLPWFVMRNYQYALLCYKNEARELPWLEEGEEGKEGKEGCMPFASHITFTQFVLFGMNSFVGDGLSEVLFHRLFASKMSSQSLGRSYCLDLTDEVREECDKIVVYDDFGTQSSGVQRAIALGKERSIPVEYKQLPPDMMKHVFGQSVLSTVVPLCSMAITAVGTAVCARGGWRFGVQSVRRFRRQWKKWHS